MRHRVIEGGQLLVSISDTRGQSLMILVDSVACEIWVVIFGIGKGL